MNTPLTSSQTWRTVFCWMPMKCAIASSLTALTTAFSIGISGQSTLAQETAPKIINSVVYRCDAGKSFSAEYRDDKTVKATFGSKVLVLPQEEAASGARYGNGSVTLFTKGNEAFVEVGDQRLFDNCVVVGSVQGLW